MNSIAWVLIVLAQLHSGDDIAGANPFVTEEQCRKEMVTVVTDISRIGGTALRRLTADCIKMDGGSVDALAVNTLTEWRNRP